MNKIIVITGPTGVGKTSLSISLAKLYNAEIINADSMQIYKDLNIGTAKITESEKENIPHHLFDIKDVTEEYSIYDYQKDCRNTIQDIISRHKNIIIVGGSGLYLKSALYDYQLEESSLNNNYDNLSNEEIYNKLISIDKNLIIDKYNRRRLTRALSRYESTGNINPKSNKLLYDCIFIGLTKPRNELYKIIDERVDIMINNGLITEAKSFYDKGIYTKPLTGGIGYKELYSYFNNEISLEESIRLIKRNSRHYAKRQYTFLNNQLDIKWFDTTNLKQAKDDIIFYINSVK